MLIKKSADNVAKAIIYNYLLKQKEDGIPEELWEYPTQLKLQKLLYFVQAAFLSLYDKPAFEEEIEAWQYGPVVKEIYNKYKEYGSKPIILDKKELEENYKSFSNDEKDLISFINDTFGKYSASKLVEITHEHLPWSQAIKRGTNISKEELKEYYKPLFEFDYE